MKFFTYWFIGFVVGLTVLVGCALGIKAPPSSQPCTAVAALGGAQVTCPDGTSVFVPNGASGAPGQDGVDGTQGTPGQAGQNGATGPTGANGANGADAIPVTSVKLCPGESTYPSAFVEYALCLEGRLFAVYSANGGFLALLPPGNYSSNAIGSSCSLTVGPNCQVTH